MKVISTYAGHESSISIYDNGKITVIELDKFTGEKYFSLGKVPPVEQCEIIEQALATVDIENKFDLWINGSYEKRRNGVLDPKKMINIINAERSIHGPGHHMCHAHCAFWQSPFHKAYLISSDGGGNDGYFNIYHCNRKQGPLADEQIDRFDLGTFYGLISSLIPQVSKTTSWFFDLAGKSMALSTILDLPVEKEIIEAVRQMYTGESPKLLNKMFSLDRRWPDRNIKMSNKNQKDPTMIDNERIGYKLAKANQQIFEEKFRNVLADRQYHVGNHDDNLILVGGCALNVINNQKLKDKGYNVFVPPNPSDGGLSLGALFWWLHLAGHPIPDQDWKFSGIPLIENKKFRKKRKTPIKTLAKMLKEGAILGIVEGNMEIGPRALGHRSIICDPSVKGIKDKLNKEVKHREPFRPFAPIVLEEHLPLYFERSDWSNLYTMSYAVKSTFNFEVDFPAACHVDGTARVQVCDDTESTVYKLLEEVGTPLLNTSFNDNGKPIISNVEDAYSMLPSLDGIVVNGVLITK